MTNRFPSKIPYASLLVYSPRGVGEVAALSRRVVRDELKRGVPRIVALVATRTRELFEAGHFQDQLGPERVLVPVPRSSPRRQGHLWVPELIADALVSEGLGARVVPALRRTRPIPKLATATSDERLVSKHVESLEVNDGSKLRNVTIVDDVVTTGGTLFAAASLMLEASGELPASFAVARSMGDEKLSSLRQPTEGWVYFQASSGRTKRRP